MSSLTQNIFEFLTALEGFLAIIKKKRIYIYIWVLENFSWGWDMKSQMFFLCAKTFHAKPYGTLVYSMVWLPIYCQLHTVLSIICINSYLVWCFLWWVYLVCVDTVDLFNYYQQMRNKSSCVFVIYLLQWLCGSISPFRTSHFRLSFEDFVMGVGCAYDMSYFVWVLGYRL